MRSEESGVFQLTMPLDVFGKDSRGWDLMAQAGMKTGDVFVGGECGIVASKLVTFRNAKSQSRSSSGHERQIREVL